MRASGAMPGQQLHHTAAPSTLLIFDHAVYLSEALGLPVNQNEEELDAELALLARESGIQDPYQFLCPPQDISRALSTLTVDSDYRSSASIQSQETQSTSFTSPPSRTSRDIFYSNQRSPARRVPPKFERASISVDSYSQAMHSSVPDPQPRHSISTLDVAQSALSSSASLPQPPRRRRGSSLFSMFRKDSGSCSSRSHHGHQGKFRGVKLECGHTLSPLAIRVHIQEAMQSTEPTVPNCCGKALPRAVMEGVLTKEETDFAMNGALRSPDSASLPDSGYSENGMSSIDLPRSEKNTLLPTATPETPSVSVRRARHQEISVNSALAYEAFGSFKVQQKEQFERVSTFECNQRKALTAHHQRSLKRMAEQHEASREERIEQHTCDIERLEERQIIAEHDLRTTHDQETQNVATALKYMEAYCLGTNVNHSEHPHIVSEEDFKKLDRQRMIQRNLPRKHENAINVLRARQERETKRRLEKQESELKQMDSEHEKEKAAKEAEYTKELERLEALIEVRRKRLLQRWDLKFEMWRRDWEEQHKTTLTAKLDHEDWPPRKADHAITIPASSALAQYVQATA